MSVSLGSKVQLTVFISGVYVEAIARKAAPGAIRKSSGVVKVAATESGVDLTLQDGTTMRFDHVIMA